MNNDVPETLAAARSRAADLEQQLKLSDEGVSRLAQRCLELEQQVLNYQAALARHGSDNEPAALTLPQLFYDSGSGYSPRECLTVAEDAYDELTHESLRCSPCPRMPVRCGWTPVSWPAA